MASLRTSLNPLVDEGIVITGAIEPAFMDVLTPDALRFVADLTRRFRERRGELLKLRAIRQHEIDAGHFPDFLADTRAIREDTWTVAPIPRDLQDRRVEITGPVDRKMVINALNSGASTYMADFEDSNSPTWENCVLGQVNLRDAVFGTIQYTSPEGKHYALADTTANRFRAGSSTSDCSSSTTPRS
jgi:malate synthase